jgi:4-amino-4-deoxy-L-arabinose transferase-like glycosyltransferase
MIETARIDSENRAWIAIGAILLLAAALRFWGIAHGYPHSYYPDEAHFVKRALSFGSGNFNPHWFHKPAFFMYLLFFQYGLFFVIGRIFGLWSGVEEFAVSFVLNPGPFFVIGRTAVVLFGLGMVYLTYRIGRILWDRRAGLLAAFALAVSPGQAWVSRDVKADVPCAFFTLASAYFLLRFVEVRRLRDLAFAVVFAGLGTATKTYSIVMLVPILAAVWKTAHPMVRLAWRKAAVGIGCVLGLYAVFFLVSPYNFLDPKGREATFGGFFMLAHQIGKVSGIPMPFSSPVSSEIAPDIYTPEINLALYWRGIVDYFRYLREGMGIPAFLLSMVGVGLFFFRERRWAAWLLFAFPLIFATVSVFVHPGYAEVRHQVPLHPFLALWAAGALHFLFERYRPPKAVAAIAVLVLCIPIGTVIAHNRVISREDTRNLAKVWVETHIPAGTKILLDENGVPLVNSEARLREEIARARELADPKGQFTAHYGRYLEYQLLAAKRSITYNIREIRYPWWRAREVEEGVYRLESEFDADMGNPLKPVGVNSYESYVREGYEYAVLQSLRYEPFLRDTDRAARFPSFARFYRELFDRAIPIRTFSPEEGGVKRPGPTVRIFRLADDRPSISQNGFSDEG